MDTIILNNNKKIIHLDNRLQVDKNNKPFKYTGLSKNLEKPSKWLKKTGLNIECWCWRYEFRYIENFKTGFFVNIGYNDEVIDVERF